MVYKRREDDTVLARFVVDGDTVRFIKRKDKFYSIYDHFVTGSSLTTETTREIILEKTRAAFEATLNGSEKTYEIWINNYIYKDLS